MQAARTALFAFIVLLALAAVACQPTDGLVEPGARQSHPVIEVPTGPTLLPLQPAATPPATPAASQA